METGRVDPEFVISDVYPLDRYFDALDKNLADPESIKIVIEPNGSSEGK